MVENSLFSNNLYNYIGHYKNKFPTELCDKIINEYSNTELWIEQGIGGGNNNKEYRSTKGIPISHERIKTTIDRKNIDDEIFNKINLIFKNYIIKFPFLKLDSDEGYLLLKYDVGDFYKIHTDYSPENKPRIISCIICLNDEYTGGEISFLNKKKIFNLNKGDVLLFPSNFMFPHEVSPILSGTRYSIATWFG